MHARHLAPGNTVAVCFRDNNIEKLNLPYIHTPLLNRRYWPQKLRESAPPAISYSDRRKLVRFLREHNVGAVLAEYGENACVVRSACDRAGVRLLAHFHGFDASEALRMPLFKLAYRRMAKSAASIICPSKYIASNLANIGLPENIIHVIPCGVDTEKFSPPLAPDRDPNLLITVGRFVEKKSPQSTIKAFAAIAKRFPNARLEMVGEGELLDECENLVGKLFLSDRVLFHGKRQHMFVRKLMGKASVFLQHSVTGRNGDAEGMPVSIMEAMASGLPVVATRHAGIPEAVVDGECGFLVEEGDTKSMSERMAELLENPSLRKKMGAAARKRAIENFDAAKSLNRIRTLMKLDT